MITQEERYKELKDQEHIAVLHDTDPDGYGAAWAIANFLPQATFFPVPHGRPDWEYTKELFPQIANFKHVIVTDLSFDRKTTLKLIDELDTFTTIDHHATAKESIGDLPGQFININNSAAMLAWRFFAPLSLAPKLTQYIQDYDLWRHKLPFTHEVMSIIQSNMDEPSIEKFEELSNMINKNFSAMVDLGKAVLKYRQAMASVCLEQTRRVSFAGHEVPCVNVSLPQLISDVGHLTNSGEAFSVSWFQQSDGTYKYSLRSRYNQEEQAVDVSKIAVEFGGGGHARASGFISTTKVI